MNISIIIPYHNEGQDFIETTVRGIKETIDVEYEIIIVDDCSTAPCEEIEGVTLIRHEENTGVGTAFDTGVAASKYDNLFLMGSDIRFVPNNWASKMIREVDNHPKAFICTRCVGINKDNMDVESRLDRGWNGATILFYHDHKSHPKKGLAFKNILEAKWLPFNKDRSKSYEIPCILGAAYGVKKEWYNYVDGWWGHRSWGTLEPYISLKSWLFGGSCRAASHIDTAHIFKPTGTHGTKLHHLVYNKLLTANLLADDKNRDRLVDFLKTDEHMKRALDMYNKRVEEITAKREEYAKKIVMTIGDYAKKFDIDLRDGEESKTIEEIKDFYEKRSKKVALQYTQRNSRLTAIDKYIASEVKQGEYESALDIGCGVGITSEMLRKYVSKVTAVDLVKINIDLAKKAFVYTDVSYKVGDFTNMTLDKFDIVCIFDTLEHIRPCDREAFLKNVKDHCNKLVLISIPNPEYLAKKLRTRGKKSLQIVDEQITDEMLSDFTIKNKKETPVYIYYTLSVDG